MTVGLAGLEPAACPPVAVNGFIPTRIQNQSIKLTDELCEAPCMGFGVHCMGCEAPLVQRRAPAAKLFFLVFRPRPVPGCREECGLDSVLLIS